MLICTCPYQFYNDTDVDICDWCHLPLTEVKIKEKRKEVNLPKTKAKETIKLELNFKIPKL